MPVKDGTKRPLVGVIDDGTKTMRFVVYEAECQDELASFQLDKTEIQPQEGWREQDPLEILRRTAAVAANTLQQLTELGYSKEDIVTLGITNQRETTVAWDKFTGEPLYAAISWNDIRTDSTVDAILAKIPDRNKNYLKTISGLPISPYSSAVKMRWLLDNVRTVRKAARDRSLLFGTVDSWIVWNLTGGPKGGLHITDVTNASRTLLMNIDTLNWDPMLCRIFGIHRDFLPEIRSSSEIYGVVKDGSVLDGITISGILGNQQSALVGHNCFKAGQAKNTYRTGCFLLYNTGTRKVNSTHGLITTVAYKMGDQPPVYALEGSIAVAGGAMKFLKNNLKVIKDVATDTERLGGQVFSTGDVYFVPAFSGLYAPYWRKDARGIICGLTAFTTKHHIIRAAMEAVCFQTRDILEAMLKDCGCALSKLHVDGRMTDNDLLMQLQADLVGIPVLRAKSWDMTPLGAAIAAGLGRGVWRLPDQPHTSDTFLPCTTHEDRNARYTKWKMAVQRSLGWSTSKKSITMTGQRKNSLQPDTPRKNSLNISSESEESRFNSVELKQALQNLGTSFESYSDELAQYSARKFSVYVPFKPKKQERTILDDAEFFMSKKECDYGACECCTKKKILTWESIEEIIENDPEIIFDSEDNPILVMPTRSDSSLDLESLDSASTVMGSGISLRKRLHLENLPAIFKSICNKFTESVS